MEDPRPVRRGVFGRTVFEVRPGHVRTLLPDGREVLGEPHDTDGYRETAGNLGYGPDTVRMNLEHEMLHSALAAWLGLPESPTMRLLAEGGFSSALANLEEDAVLALQRFANAAGIDLTERFLG